MIRMRQITYDELRRELPISEWLTVSREACRAGGNRRRQAVRAVYQRRGETP
jgi:hypothetical protein